MPRAYRMVVDMVEAIGCKDCPFAEELWSGCTHPKATDETSLAVSGITDARLAKGATPQGCPLRSGPTVVALKQKRARGRR